METLFPANQPFTVIIDQSNLDLEAYHRGWGIWKNTVRPAMSSRYQLPEELGFRGLYASGRELAPVIAKFVGDRYQFVVSADSVTIFGPDQRWIISQPVTVGSNLIIWTASPIGTLGDGGIPLNAQTASQIDHQNSGSQMNTFDLPLKTRRDFFNEELGHELNIQPVLLKLLDQIGFPTVGATVLVKDNYSAAQIDDDIPREMKIGLIQEMSWMGFSRQSGQLMNMDIYFPGYFSRPEQIVEALSERFPLDGIRYVLRADSLDLYYTKGQCFTQLHIYQPFMIEQKIVWWVKKDTVPTLPANTELLGLNV